MRFIKTKSAAPMGVYKPTGLDAVKASVDFRLTQVSPAYIVWKDGRGEKVTDRQLAKLQAAHSWTTDF